MKVCVNPEFEQYTAFVKTIPDIFHTEGKTIFRKRNEIKIFTQQGVELVVKSFKIPHFINKIAYSAVRASKAERAFTYALTLLDQGISTPAPVAYIEIKKFGMLFNSFFISTKSRFHREIREISNLPEDHPEVYLILEDFARFTAGLHEKGIFHKDYGPGNILFGKTGGRYEFELVDLNRMKFKKIDLKTGCKAFNRLGFRDEWHRFILQKYTDARSQPNM